MWEPRVTGEQTGWGTFLLWPDTYTQLVEYIIMNQTCLRWQDLIVKSEVFRFESCLRQSSTHQEGAFELLSTWWESSEFAIFFPPFLFRTVSMSLILEVYRSHKLDTCTSSATWLCSLVSVKWSIKKSQ